MKTWFTSDHHFGHANIIKYCNRPFSNTHEMNVAMEGSWNRVVGHNDLVYYLGDFAMNVRLVPFLLNRLNGIKILVPGNHDKCWQKKDTSGRWYKHYVEAGFKSIEQHMRLEIAGESVLLNHLPYRNEGDPDQRYFEERPVDDGGWLIHGHVHNRWKVSGKQINVSVENWNFEPVNMSVIADIVAAGPQLKEPQAMPRLTVRLREIQGVNDMKTHIANVIDLELSCYPGNEFPPGETKEIIEVGLAIVDLRSLSITKALSMPIVPSVSTISPYCTELTGWTDAKLKRQGVEFKEACRRLSEKYGGKNRLLITDSDDPEFFRKQCLAMQVNYPFGTDCINVSTLFALFTGEFRNVSFPQVVGRGCVLHRQRRRFLSGKRCHAP